MIEFFKRKRIEAREILQSSKKTPDFELYISSNLSAYCELKSIMPCQSPSSKMPTGQVREVIINGKAPVNDIKKDIHSARKQFRSLNRDHKVPNIVFFINHNRLRNVGDLKDVLGVESSNVGGFFPPLYRNKLLGKDDLEVVDYIIFVECQAKKVGHKNDFRGSTMLDGLTKDFLNCVGRDEKWAKEVISTKHSILNIPYYCLMGGSRFKDILKEKISSKEWESLK